MRSGEEPDPPADGGDPACWAHLFDDDDQEGEGGGVAPEDEPGE